MNRLICTIVAVLALAWTGGARAATDSVTLKVGNSTSPVGGQVAVKIGAQTILVPIPPMASATLKRDLIRNAVSAAGHPVTDNGPGGNDLTIHGLTMSQAVTFSTNNTGEVLDSLRHSTCGEGQIRFVGPFQPFTPNNQPAVFTAGIVTDVGELTTQVSAQELNFQTDGPIICQALFQRLAPRAPQYGAQINYAGDRLEVYFDPAYTVTQGGIIFGTDSPSPGCSGYVEDEALRRLLRLTVGPSTNPVIETELISLSLASIDPIIVMIPPQQPPPQVCSILVDGLRNAGAKAFQLPDPDTLWICHLPPKSGAIVRPGGTGQAQNTLRGPRVLSGRIAFEGPFQPMDYGGLPAVFTAGIVTDVGELSAQVSAQELNFQTDGPIICQALFQRLAPHAPPYGAQINYAGDRLEVYFDPAYTVTQGGVIFGTTSPSEGCEGTARFMGKTGR